MASADIRFDEGHMWVRVEEDSAVVGLTDYAQDKMGEIIFVELPEEGAMVIRGDACGTLESVKSVEDLLAPVSGEVVAVNEDVLDAPEAINDDPYGEGWLFEVKLDDESELSSLMSEEDYENLLDSMEGEEEDEDF
ncbi:MAG: glycine cleavage system protein GcvH [Armatimonadetes bacterium]|nr:glycine cleavage system protein GcvH [Armatimonadota bacterium]